MTVVFLEMRQHGQVVRAPLKNKLVYLSINELKIVQSTNSWGHFSD